MTTVVDELGHRLLDVALLEGDFTLRSGKRSRWYLDKYRFETEPEIVLDEDDFVPAVELASELEHVRKWPAEHWQLAFQGQLRTISDADAARLGRRLREAAPAAA